nr:hypothetical protein [Tanacetum cinerariifolium]
IDGEYYFRPKESLNEDPSSPSAKSVNNKVSVVNAEPISAVHPSNVDENVGDAGVVNAEPISAVHPLNVDENVGDAGGASSKNDGVTQIDPSKPHYSGTGNSLKISRKRKRSAGSHRDVGGRPRNSSIMKNILGRLVWSSSATFMIKPTYEVKKDKAYCHEPNSKGSGSAWKVYINARVAGLILLVLLEYPNRCRSSVRMTMHEVVHEMVVGECHEPNSEGSGSAWKAYINARVAGLFLLVLLEYPNGSAWKAYINARVTCLFLLVLLEYPNGKGVVRIMSRDSI